MSFYPPAMSPLVIALVLVAALLHASWNAILRGGADRLWSITIMGTVGAAACLPFALMLPPPAPESWPWIALSATLQIFYCLFLVRAYRDGELGHVYPIARGTAPLLVSVGAALLTGEQMGLSGWAGVALVSGGIMILAMGKARPDARSTAAALAAGAFIASYMVADGMGVRASASALGYGAWQGMAQGLLMTAVYAAIRPRLPALPRGPAGAQVVAAALIGVFGYCVVIWAMSLAPMGKVSALRETSILFAALIGVVVLKEPLTVRRVVGAVVVAAGAVALGWS